MEGEEDAYQHTEEITNEIEADRNIPGEQKEIAYCLMRNIFRIGRAMDNYEMSDIKEYLVQALDTIYDLMKKGDRKNIEKMRKISLASESIYRHIDLIQDKIEEISKEVESIDKGLESKVVENTIQEIEDKKDDIYKDTTEKIEEIQRLDLTPEEEKELAYKIGSAVLDVGNEMKIYNFEDAPLFIHDAFIRIYTMIQSGRNNEYEIPIIKELAKDSERILRYLRLVEVLVQKVDTNVLNLEKRVKREDTERKKIIGEIISEMKGEK